MIKVIYSGIIKGCGIVLYGEMVAEGKLGEELKLL